MARDLIAKTQDKRAKERAEREVGTLAARVSALRALREAGQTDPDEVEVLKAIEELMEGFAPKFSQAGVREDGYITFSGAGFITVLAGQIAAMMEEKDADNYLFVPFTIGPKDGGPQYEFTVNRLAPGKMDMATKNGALVGALKDVLALSNQLTKANVGKGKRFPSLAFAAAGLARICLGVGITQRDLTSSNEP